MLNCSTTVQQKKSFFRPDIADLSKYAQNVNISTEVELYNLLDIF